MAKSFDDAYAFAELDAVEGAIDDIRTLERKLSEAYGSAITLIAFVDDANKSGQ